MEWRGSVRRHEDGASGRTFFSKTLPPKYMGKLVRIEIKSSTNAPAHNSFPDHFSIYFSCRNIKTPFLIFLFVKSICVWLSGFSISDVYFFSLVFYRDLIPCIVVPSQYKIWGLDKKREKRDTYCFLCRIWQPRYHLLRGHLIKNTYRFNKKKIRKGVFVFRHDK